MRSAWLQCLVLGGTLTVTGSGCYRYVNHEREPTSADCGPPAPSYSYFRSWPDSSAPGLIHGTVFDTQRRDSVRTVGSASVLVESTLHVAATSGDGKFSLGPLGPGRYALRTRRVGYQMRLDSITVSSGFGRRVEIGLDWQVTDGCPGFMVIVERKREWVWPWQK